MSTNRITLSIPAMDCIQEETQIREALAPIAGLRRLSFLLAQRRLEMEGSPDALAQARQAIEAAGFPAQAQTADEAAAPADNRLAWRLGVALVLALLTEALSFLPDDGRGWLTPLSLAMAAAALVLSGPDTYRKGLQALRQGRLDINALMAVAVTGAVLIGEWPEAAMVMALYAIAELIEARAVDRARRSVQALLALAPDTAMARNADGGWQEVPVSGIQPGTVLRVRAGERVALDGRVLSGHSSIDEAPISGESLPVEKQPGSGVYAGTINGNGLLEIEVTTAQQDTTLARIAEEVEKAQAHKAPMQRFVDRFARIYTPLVFVLALLVSAYAAFWLGESATEAIYRGLVMLVIACPCALVIATPVTVVSGLTAAARRGILVKGGVHLENARKLRALALDKTGTLTTGRPVLVGAQWFAPATTTPDALAWRDDDAARRGLAQAVAQASDHPVSQAIAVGLAADGTAAMPVLDALQAVPGQGVRTTVNGATVGLGNRRLAESMQAWTPAVAEAVQAHEAQGHSVSLLLADGDALALFAVADTLKPTSRAAIEALGRQGVATIMLTGDNPGAAAAIARDSGITEAHGGLLPSDKQRLVLELKARYGATGMTGDGINDAPALAQADLSLAMGSAGTDIAMQTADVVIMNDDLRRIPELLTLSGRVHRILWQNIVLALGIKAVFMVLAVLGAATLWMAVFADVGASLIVVANGLRLLSGAPTARPAPAPASACCGHDHGAHGTS